MIPGADARYRRVLVVDDEPAVLDAYRRVLDPFRQPPAAATALDDLSAELFGEAPAAPPVDAAALLDEVVYHRQGEDAAKAVAEAVAANRPFAIAFLDMRMPPGIDGLETARRIRAMDSNINLVIVTGYSDHRPAEIGRQLGPADKFLYLVKPFDVSELQQLTTSLAEKWSSDVRRAEELSSRVAELETLNAELQASEQRAREMALQDPLTGLPNRKALTQHASTVEGRQISALYLDLDRFKDINDFLGHGAGDQLICEFGALARKAVGDAGFLARLGGDEFAILVSDRRDVPGVTARLLEESRNLMMLQGTPIRTSVSIGIAHSPVGRFDLLDLMRRADIALYAAKLAGRGVAREYDSAMEQDLRTAQRVAVDLAGAAARGEFFLEYQPLVAPDGRTITAVEALIRWNHPVRGIIPPDEFIPIAEKSDLIMEIGDWVLTQAMADAAGWPELMTAINISPAQFRYPGFVDGVVKIAAGAAIATDRIELEITESALITEFETTLREIVKLRQEGFKIALDDFGTGNAGINYLSRIPLDKLKLDRTLVQRLRSVPGGEVVLRSVVSLARGLGLSITAEGVEDEEMHRFLLGAGCSQMQGFFYHRPTSREGIAKLRRDALPQAKAG